VTASAPVVQPNGAESRRTASDQSSPTLWKGRRLPAKPVRCCLGAIVSASCGDDGADCVADSSTWYSLSWLSASRIIFPKGLLLSRSVWIYFVNILASLVRIWSVILVYAKRTCLDMLVFLPGKDPT